MSEPEQTPDPEIQALLDFEPVPRKRVVDGAWTPELQREFISRLALTGSPGRACDEMGKNETGITKLYRSPAGKSFRAAWDGAVALAQRRKAEQTLAYAPVAPGSRPPSLDNRRKFRVPMQDGPLPGQFLNIHGEWEDEATARQRAAEAKDSISRKLLRARRLYLQEISTCPGKRAAYEILTEFPVDWDKVERLEPQADEPFRFPRMRQPDMLLTAENGWMGDLCHGPDKKAEIREELNRYLIEHGKEPIDWDGPDPDP